LTDHVAIDIFGDHLIFLLIEHQTTHTSATIKAWASHIFYYTVSSGTLNSSIPYPYILTHNWKLFFLHVWCSVCVIGCQHISSHILSTKGCIHIMTVMQTFGAYHLFILICTLSMGFSLK